MFHRRQAELRTALGQVIPPPHNEQACLDLRNYMMAVMHRYWKPDRLEVAITYLDDIIKMASELGNLLMVQPTSWRWEFGQDDPDIDRLIIDFPGFRCVLDEKGQPYTMEHRHEVVDAYINSLEELYSKAS
jgi:hypothetical protein